MLTPEEANLLLTNLSGRTCDLSFEEGRIIIGMMPDGGTLYVRPDANMFSLEKLNTIADYVIDQKVTPTSSCTHPEEDVECVAQMEYPGGEVLWCGRCGAWTTDNDANWHEPRIEEK